MKTVKGWVTTRKIGSLSEFEFEVEDDATEDEIHDAAEEKMRDSIDWDFEVVS